jgi:DtxR family Mn-dependent transcriptional regulator
MPNKTVAGVSGTPELVTTSESEQMYLITIARYGEAGGEGPVPMAHIAGRLEVSVPAANEMVRKLETRGLVSYEPYRGVRLSDVGRSIASQVLRTRRLWATFLADHLGFSPVVADAQACHLEHATSEDAADRLASYLGNPTVGPLGGPIPCRDGDGRSAPSCGLCDLDVGDNAEIMVVAGPDTAFGFLRAEGLEAGAMLRVVAIGATGVLIEVADHLVHLSRELAGQIEARRVGTDGAADAGT